MLEKLISIAEGAGGLILDVYNREDFNVKIKDDNSPLTEADKKSHNLHCKRISKKLQGDPGFI